MVAKPAIPRLRGNADCRYGPSDPRPARPGVYSGSRGAVPSLRRVPYRSRDGGTGRRAGLKIQYWRQCASSSLAPGTNPSLPARHARRRLDPRAPPASTALRPARIGAGRGRPAAASIRTLPTSIPRPPSADGGTPPALPPPARREVRRDLALRVRHAFRTPVCRNLRAVPAFSERATGSGSAGRRGRSSAACRTGGRSRRRRGRSRSPRR